MPSRRLTFLVALLLAALTQQRSDAGLIPWSYSWDAHPIVIQADPPAPHDSPTGGITLTPGAITITGGNPGVALGNATVIAVNLTAFAFAPSPGATGYHFSNAPYHLGVSLTDVNSNTSGILSFSGVFDGSFTSSGMNLHTRFTSPCQQAVLLGHDIYKVKLTGYSPPGPPSTGGAGKISALVTVQAASEPSTLALAAFGTFFTLVRLRRRSCGKENTVASSAAAA